jgi:hypothetical protein
VPRRAGPVGQLYHSSDSDRKLRRPSKAAGACEQQQRALQHVRPPCNIRRYPCCRCCRGWQWGVSSRAGLQLQCGVCTSACAGVITQGGPQQVQVSFVEASDPCLCNASNIRQLGLKAKGVRSTSSHAANAVRPFSQWSACCADSLGDVTALPPPPHCLPCHAVRVAGCPSSTPTLECRSTTVSP